MRRYTLEEFFSDPEFESLIIDRDRKYYNHNGILKERGKFIETLSEQYLDVSFEGKGKKIILTIGKKNPSAPPRDKRVNNNFSEVDYRILKNFSEYLKEEILKGYIREGDSKTIMKWLFNSYVLGEQPHIYNTFKSLETGEFKEASQLIEEFFKSERKREIDSWEREYYAIRRIDYDVYEKPKVLSVILNPLTQRFLISEYTMFISSIFKNITKRLDFIEFEQVMCLKYKTRSVLVSEVKDIPQFFSENKLTYEISLYDEIVEAEEAEELLSRKLKENLKKTYFVLSPIETLRKIMGTELNSFDNKRKSLKITGRNYYNTKEYQKLLFEEYNTKEAWIEYGIKQIDMEKLEQVDDVTFDVLDNRQRLMDKFENKIINQELYQEYYPVLREYFLFNSSEMAREFYEDVLFINNYGRDSIDYKVKRDRIFYLSLYAIAKILSDTQMDILKYLNKRDEKIKNDILSNSKELNLFLYKELEEPFGEKFKNMYFEVYPEYKKRIDEYLRSESMLTSIDSDEEFEDRLDQLKEEYKDVRDYL